VGISSVEPRHELPGYLCELHLGCHKASFSLYTFLYGQPSI
jgi:hypothetical protein